MDSASTSSTAERERLPEPVSQPTGKEIAIGSGAQPGNSSQLFGKFVDTLNNQFSEAYNQSQKRSEELHTLLEEKTASLSEVQQQNSRLLKEVSRIQTLVENEAHMKKVAWKQLDALSVQVKEDQKLISAAKEARQKAKQALLVAQEKLKAQEKMHQLQVAMHNTELNVDQAVSGMSKFADQSHQANLARLQTKSLHKREVAFEELKQAQHRIEELQQKLEEQHQQRRAAEAVIDDWNEKLRQSEEAERQEQAQAREFDKQVEELTVLRSQLQVKLHHEHNAINELRNAIKATENRNSDLASETKQKIRQYEELVDQKKETLQALRQEEEKLGARAVEIERATEEEQRLLDAAQNKYEELVEAAKTINEHAQRALAKEQHRGSTALDALLAESASCEADNKALWNHLASLCTRLESASYVVGGRHL
eukprot:gnl/Spiro4/24125_TR11971_c0_g1_i1.p2 gnl/Spiro4/24125_TR11971_c0_g1~~gnl/Spiro4/24125_TR11971_c0_g1_i1.p2  ORF type:complete len:440 (+),score=159.20 gnl/Spiro4/24125_TR11971_c0_g1_i1:45-1322(+)